jgi:hypothetical protein
MRNGPILLLLLFLCSMLAYTLLLPRHHQSQDILQTAQEEANPGASVQGKAVSVQRDSALPCPPNHRAPVAEAGGSASRGN